MRGRGRPRTKTKKIEKYFSGLIYVISWQWITSSIDSTLRVFCGDEQKVLRFRFFLVKSKELPRSLSYFEISRQFWTVKYALINKLFERNCLKSKISDFLNSNTCFCSRLYSNQKLRRTVNSYKQVCIYVYLQSYHCIWCRQPKILWDFIYIFQDLPD